MVVDEILLTSMAAQYPLAFEAALKGNGDLTLTVVGQGAFIDREIAEELLGQVETAFTALKSANDVISVQSSNPDALKSGEVAKNIAFKKQEFIVDEDFKWTQTAKDIRSEISSLAKAPEESVTPNTTIFSLGLDSIDVIKLVSRLKMRGVKVSVSSLVKSQTIANLMSQITQQQQATTQVNVPIKQFEDNLRASLAKAGKLSQDIVSVLPATPLQEGMVAEMIASEYTRYFNHELYRVDDGVDMEKLKKAWESVIIQSDILRTTFVEIDDVEIDIGFAQIVHAGSNASWERIEFPQTADLEDETKKCVKAAIEAAKQGRLLQLRDISHGKDRYYLLSMSHALYDGWSLQALHGDVQKVYNDQSITRPDPKATLEQVLNANGAEATKFWRTALSGLPKSEFPLHSTSSGTINRCERASSISLGNLQAFCRTTNISLQTLGQTAWALLLANHLKRLDVAFGVVLSCRDTEEANELMFPLMNTVAVRSVLYGTLEDMLRYMQDNSNAMRPFQHFPLRKAQALAGNRDGGLFDTLFIYQGKSNDEGREKKLCTAINSQSEVEFAVCVEMEVVGEELVWRTACRDAARTVAETAELLESLDAVISRIIQDPTSPTIASSIGGISICGLPAFVDDTSKLKSKGQATKPIKHANDEWSTTETIIRTVLAQVSKSAEAEISKDHSIFHLGLDSISAIKVSSLLRRRGIYIGVHEIMKNNTIRTMAEVVTNQVHAPAPREVVDVDSMVATSLAHIDRADVLQRAGVEESNVEDCLPVSAGQLYMLPRWLESGGTQFAANFQYRVDRALVGEKLEKAWKAVLLRHSILRTIFVVTNDDKVPAVQIVLRETRNPVVWGSSDNEVSLLRPVFLVVEKKEEHQVVSIRIHHALYDAISLPLILQDLEALYANISSALLPPLRFKDFIARDLDAKTAQQRESFWKSYLPSVASSSPAPAAAPTGKKIEVFTPSVSIGDITTVAQKTGVTVDALILAAFATAYNKITAPETESATIGLYLANRSADADLSSLAAPTLNLLPLHIASTGAALSEVAKSVQSDLQKISARENVGASLKEIYEWTGMRVGVFVNLLKSSGDEEEAPTQGCGEALFATSLSVDGMLRPRAEIVDVCPDAALRGGFKGMGESVREAYMVGSPASFGGENGTEKTNRGQPSIDVELRLVGGGRGIDVGVFAPEELLDLVGAERLIEELREVLSGVE